MFSYSSLCARKLVETMKRVTRSMSRAQSQSSYRTNESEDIKPDNLDVTYRQPDTRTGRFSQTHTFRSMEERTANGIVYGAENDIALLKYVKNEPGDPSQRSQCQCQINLRLSKP